MKKYIYIYTYTLKEMMSCIGLSQVKFSEFSLILFSKSVKMFRRHEPGRKPVLTIRLSVLKYYFGINSTVPAVMAENQFVITR